MDQEQGKQVFERPELKSYTAIDPKIYAYQTPGVVKHEGWTKIGEARRQSVEARIKQQTQTVGVDWELRWGWGGLPGQGFPCLSGASGRGAGVGRGDAPEAGVVQDRRGGVAGAV